MKQLVIVGAGGLGREVAWLVERINKVSHVWNLKGFVDDTPNLQGNVVNGYRVLGGCDWLVNNNDKVYAVCAIACAKARKSVIQRLKGVKFATIIDPDVLISERVTIGNGSIVCANSIISVNINIGSHVIIDKNCTIGHDAELKNFVTLYPSVNVSGNTILEECVEMGTGSQLIQKLKIGEGTIVGAGAVVVQELPKECTAVGCPAKPIKIHTSI